MENEGREQLKLEINNLIWMYSSGLTLKEAEEMENQIFDTIIKKERDKE